MSASVAAAWAEYLEDTRGVELPRYREIEPWAWARLQQRLEQTQAKSRPTAA